MEETGVIDPASATDDPGDVSRSCALRLSFQHDHSGARSSLIICWACRCAIRNLDMFSKAEVRLRAGRIRTKRKEWCMSRLAIIALTAFGYASSAVAQAPVMIKCSVMTAKVDKDGNDIGGIFEVTEYYKFSDQYLAKYNADTGELSSNLCPEGGYSVSSTHSTTCAFGEKGLIYNWRITTPFSMGQPSQIVDSDFVKIDRYKGEITHHTKEYRGYGTCRSISSFPKVKARSKKF